MPDSALAVEPAPGSSPLLRDVFTADPAPLVVGDTAYLHVGHDEARADESFRMNERRGYSSHDLKHWTSHGAVMKPIDSSRGTGDVWAAPMAQHGGRLYFYATVTHDSSQSGRAIGVADADNPLGSFKDARGVRFAGEPTGANFTPALFPLGLMASGEASQLLRRQAKL